jgi:gamma-glutamylcyclotransferase (GGCT)/AIG2-like uncharacterized protein YtfP
MSKFIECLFYGSLRKGQYNGARMKAAYGEDNFKYIKSFKINGFALYDTGRGYPAVVKSSNDDTLEVELFRLSEQCYDSINNMELGAGYEMNLYKDGNKLYPLYIYNKVLPSFTRVPNGDWVHYLNNKINK